MRAMSREIIGRALFDALSVDYTTPKVNFTQHSHFAFLTDVSHFTVFHSVCA